MYAKNTASLMKEVRTLKETIKGIAVIAICVVAYARGCNSAYEAGKFMVETGHSDLTLREFMTETFKETFGMPSKFD